MTQRDADHYRAHKDDPAEWGDPQPAPRSPRRRLASMISVRFTPAEEQRVRAVAASRGLSVSRFIRQAALGRVAPPRVDPPGIPTQTRSSGTAVCWDDGRVDGGTFVATDR